MALLGKCPSVGAAINKICYVQMKLKCVLLRRYMRGTSVHLFIYSLKANFFV